MKYILLTIVYISNLPGMITLIITILFMGFTDPNPDAVRESIEDLSYELKETVEVRNFHKAKHILHKMLPLMKKDIKYEKKQIVDYQKEHVDCEQEVKEWTEHIKLKEKSLLYTKTLLHTSSAAIRAKSAELMITINKYLMASL
jgi:hypothetical protein